MTDSNLPFMVRYQIKRLWCGRCGHYTGGLPCTECITRYLQEDAMSITIHQIECTKCSLPIELRCSQHIIDCENCNSRRKDGNNVT